MKNPSKQIAEAAHNLLYDGQWPPGELLLRTLFEALDAYEDYAGILNPVPSGQKRVESARRKLVKELRLNGDFDRAYNEYIWARSTKRPEGALNESGDDCA